MAKRTLSAASIPGGIGFSVGISLIITILGGVIGALLLNNETIKPESIDLTAIIIQTISSAAGALIATVRIQRMRMQMCLVTGGCYFLILLALNAMLFEGQYSSIGATVLAVLGGSGSVAILGIFKNKQAHKGKMKRAYR